MPQTLCAATPQKVAFAQIPVTPQKFPNTTPNLVKIIHCDVVFGSPSSDCRGTGICKISGTYERSRLPEAKKECRHTLGQAAVSPDGRLSLFFFREFLCIRLYRQHFQKGVLNMQEACSIPGSISAGLSIEAKQILPGQYRILECDGYFRVDVDCAV